MSHLVSRLQTVAPSSVCKILKINVFYTTEEMKVEDLVKQCEELLLDNRLQEAFNKYTEWIDSSHTDSQVAASHKALAYNNRGHILYFKVEFEDAINDYNEAIKYEPNFPSAYYNRGTIMYRMGYFSEAVNDMVKAITLDPTNSEYRLALEKCKLESNKNTS